MTFLEYLQQKNYSAATQKQYELYCDRFISWLQEDQLLPETFTYNDLLAFMRHCMETGITKRTVHSLLNIIRHFCNYLIDEKRRTDNPAAGLYIKGLTRKLPTNILSIEELEELFLQYRIQLNVDVSKKIMLGLLIYQGLSVGELLRIQLHHFKLKDGKVFIKATNRTNERTLDLKAVQIPELQQYLKANKFKEGPVFIEARKKEVSERNIHNRIKHLFDQLRKLNPKVINAKQIRSSVITDWLKRNSLRQVQYLAGHKYVSSTDRYQVSNLDDLQHELQQHHPMK